MPRPRKQPAPKRTHQISFRVSEEERSRLEAEANRAGMKLAPYCQSVALKRRLTVATVTFHRMEPALFAELRRVGNNVNQIAHAINSNLPPHVQFAAQSLNAVLQTLLRDDLLNRRIEALRTRTHFHGAAPPETGVQLQGRLRVYPARRRQGDS